MQTEFFFVKILSVLSLPDEASTDHFFRGLEKLSSMRFMNSAHSRNFPVLWQLARFTLYFSCPVSAR